MSLDGAWPLWPLARPLPRIGEILWSDTEQPRAPFENAARVRKALFEALGREEPAFPDDPASCQWTRVAHQLLAASGHGVPLKGSGRRACDALGGDPAAALERHLERLPPHPLGFPARGAGLELRLHPLGFRLPGAEFAEPAVRAGLPYHERHAPLVGQTLEAMARFAPDSFRTFGRVIRWIGLKPRDEGGYDDFSEPDLPGTFVASVIEHPLEMADHFIHELQHNRLQAVEESGPLFAGASAEEPRFYSPWRDKLRGLYGIFHGVYVFVAVYRFWRGVHRGGSGGPYALDRVVRLPLQLALAARVLERHAELTPLGRAILDRLLLDIEEILADVGLPSDAPAYQVLVDGTVVALPLTVRGALLEHLRRNDVHRQCDGILW